MKVAQGAPPHEFVMPALPLQAQQFQQLAHLRFDERGLGAVVPKRAYFLPRLNSCKRLRGRQDGAPSRLPNICLARGALYGQVRP